MRYPQILVSLRFLVWFSTLGVFGVKPSTLAAVAVDLFLLKSRSWDLGACVGQSTRLVPLRAQLASPMVPGEPSRNLHFFFCKFQSFRLQKHLGCRSIILLAQLSTASSAAAPSMLGTGEKPSGGGEACAEITGEQSWGIFL